MITTIFLGPSMPHDEARSLLPDAVFRPPAAQGDLLAAIDQDGAEILGLIDGTFHQNLSVWHNEVCYLLSRGITIFGASSMGALRAVETDRFGMIGVGTIYNWYKHGIITGDDEVALLHGDERTNYVQMSLPLVNIRASFAQAVTQGSLENTYAEKALDFASSLYYPNRRLPLIFEACRTARFPSDQLGAVEKALTEDYVDLKRADARELLIAIQRILDGHSGAPEAVPFEFTRSSVFETLYNLDRQVRIADTTVTLQDIAEHAALYSTEFDELRRNALNREIVIFFGLLLGLRVEKDDIMAERASFLEKRDIHTPESLSKWLQENVLNEGDLWEYLAQEVLCRRLRRWALSSRSFDRGCKALLDEIRIKGTFPHWAEETSEKAAIVAAYHDQPEYRDIYSEHPKELAERHAAYANVRITGDARIWAEDAGFDGVNELADALRKCAIFNDVRSRIAKQLDALSRMTPAGNEEGYRPTP
jgi:hypothetical protein